MRVLPHERQDLACRELVSRTAAPDVARLALILTSVGQRQIELDGRGEAAHVCLKQTPAHERAPPLLVIHPITASST